jgi:hypothetical protein
MTARIRRLAGFATTAAMLALLALSPAMPVSALDRAADTIRVTENQTVEKEFGPLASMNPLPGLPSAPPPVPVPKWNTPETCRQVTYCDVIPLEVVLPPTLKPADEFFVSVTLSWETSQVPATDYSKAQDVNDLDLIVWNDPVAEDGQPAKAGATATQPESLRLFSPRKGKYSIVVFNYLGPNTGYKLKVEYKPERIEPPFELLPQEFTAPATFPTPFEPPFEAPETPPTLPIDTSGTEEPAPVVAPPTPVETAPPALTPVAIDPDPDFTNFADDAFDEQLAAPVTDVLTEKQVKAVGPPRPASTSSLVFWLAVVPMLLVAAAGLWLSKKGSAVLKLR